MSKPAYVVNHNWNTDCSYAVFTTKPKAIRYFKKLVQELLEEEVANEIITLEDARQNLKDAVKSERYEYSGDGSDENPYVDISECELNPT